MTTELDFDACYRVHGWPAVAVYIHSYPQRWEPYTYLCTDDEGNEWEEDSGDGEWVDDLDCGQVRVVMVGDDYKHTVDIDDLEKIDDLDYCAECGQIGCCHDGRERE